MKNIFQLAKLARRAARRSAVSLKLLTKPARKNPDAKPWKNNSGINVGFHRTRISVCHLALTAVKQDLLQRRIGLPGVRDARPLRIQKLELQNAPL